MTRDIKSCTREELLDCFQEWDQPAYRVDQLLKWVYERRVARWDAMTNLPKALRERLQRDFTFHSLECVRLQGAQDSTRKFLWRLGDGALVESVLIPANPALYGEASDRHTLCVSTQVGCAYGCKFCASGLDGWKRHLDPNEIVEQVLAIERWHKETGSKSDTPMLKAGESKPSRVDSLSTGAPALEGDTRLVNNLVIMGMGEPLANYEHLLKALAILNAPWGGGIGARKITISTSGLVPEIRRLADQPSQFRLAISLHGATDDVRQRLMPINRKYPLQALMAACDYYQEQKGRMISFEYILIAGVNDQPAQAKPLAALARRVHAKVNLIPYNRVEGFSWERPSEAAQEAFLNALQRERISVTLRREKGHDIDAACGQLRLRTERELGGEG